MKNYYLVTCKCGHVGRCQYIPITYPIMAENGKIAAKIARNIPRVKHNHSDAILKCEKVDFSLYYEQMQLNNNDPYLMCRTKSDQKRLDLTDRLVLDKHYFKTNKYRDRTKNNSHKERININYKKFKSYEASFDLNTLIYC